MTLLTDWELWACARQVLGAMEDDAPAFAAERIEALAALGDSAGVLAWQSIAKRIGLLMDQRTGAPLSLQ